MFSSETETHSAPTSLFLLCSNSVPWTFYLIDLYSSLFQLLPTIFKKPYSSFSLSLSPTSSKKSLPRLPIGSSLFCLLIFITFYPYLFYGTHRFCMFIILLYLPSFFEEKVMHYTATNLHTTWYMQRCLTNIFHMNN